MTVVRVSGVEDFAELGVRWRDLERRASPSFFQSWTWVGCLAAERFADPVLVTVIEDGRAVALALFNRVRRWLGPAVLYLGESGTAELDCPYVEQNGVLAATGREDELTALCLRAVASRYDLILSGISQSAMAVLGRAAGLARVAGSRASPFVDLASLRATGKDYLAGRSANTRQQIGRSNRLYERQGPIVIERASAVGSAQAMLDEMAELHQTAWRARGHPGCFARPFFRRFHVALIAAASARDEVAVLKVSCNHMVIGILYSFVHRRRMVSYQSGFVYRDLEPRAKPGLTCHHRAIGFAMDQGLDIYEFLAGEDRYKRSLADGSYQQIWAAAGPVWSPRALLGAGLNLAR